MAPPKVSYELRWRLGKTASADSEKFVQVISIVYAPLFVRAHFRLVMAFVLLSMFVCARELLHMCAFETARLRMWIFVGNTTTVQGLTHECGHEKRVVRLISLLRLLLASVIFAKLLCCRRPEIG